MRTTNKATTSSAIDLPPPNKKLTRARERLRVLSGVRAGDTSAPVGVMCANTITQKSDVTW